MFVNARLFVAIVYISFPMRGRSFFVLEFKKYEINAIILQKHL